jgi:hypothetical protein
VIGHGHHGDSSTSPPSAPAPPPPNRHPGACYRRKPTAELPLRPEPRVQRGLLSAGQKPGNSSGTHAASK